MDKKDGGNNVDLFLVWINNYYENLIRSSDYCKVNKSVAIAVEFIIKNYEKIRKEDKYEKL